MNTATNDAADIYMSEGAPSLATRVFSHVISIIFHPLFIPVYVTAFLLFVHPLVFAGYDDVRKWRLLATVVVNLAFLPVVTVFLSWRLGFLSGFFLKTQKERIIPLAAAMIFYFWCWFVLRNLTDIPVVFRDFLFGSFLTVIAGWLLNISYKISLHSLGAGGLVAFMFILLTSTDGGTAWYLALALLVAGLICSARLIGGAHHPFEIYSGFIVGVLCQAASLML
jgi:membrane-associated phospholipid phosphatase